MSQFQAPYVFTLEQDSAKASLAVAGERIIWSNAENQLFIGRVNHGVIEQTGTLDTGMPFSLFTAHGNTFYWLNPDNTTLYMAEINDNGLGSNIGIDGNCLAILIAATEEHIYWLDPGDPKLHRGKPRSGHFDDIEWIHHDFKATEFATSGNKVFWNNGDGVLRSGEVTNGELNETEPLIGSNWNGSHLTGGDDNLLWIDEDKSIRLVKTQNIEAQNYDLGDFELSMSLTQESINANFKRIYKRQGEKDIDEKSGDYHLKARIKPHTVFLYAENGNKQRQDQKAFWCLNIDRVKYTTPERQIESKGRDLWAIAFEVDYRIKEIDRLDWWTQDRYNAFRYQVGSNFLESVEEVVNAKTWKPVLIYKEFKSESAKDSIDKRFCSIPYEMSEEEMSVFFELLQKHIKQHKTFESANLLAASKIQWDETYASMDLAPISLTTAISFNPVNPSKSMIHFLMNSYTKAPQPFKPHDDRGVLINLEEHIGNNEDGEYRICEKKLIDKFLNRVEEFLIHLFDLEDKAESDLEMHWERKDPSTFSTELDFLLYGFDSVKGTGKKCQLRKEAFYEISFCNHKHPEYGQCVLMKTTFNIDRYFIEDGWKIKSYMGGDLNKYLVAVDRRIKFHAEEGDRYPYERFYPQMDEENRNRLVELRRASESPITRLIWSYLQGRGLPGPDSPYPKLSPEFNEERDREAMRLLDTYNFSNNLSLYFYNEDDFAIKNLQVYHTPKAGYSPDAPDGKWLNLMANITLRSLQ